MLPLYPLLLRPAFHVKVWGGRRLQTLLNKDLPTDEPYGETWEMHDTATVVEGALSGRSLGDLLREYGHALVGADNDPADGFPLLAKFLDANDWLSVQVHPNDAQARELEGEPRGKTEAWYFFATDPGVRIVKGMRPGTTREVMAQAIRDNALEPLLAYEEVNVGDVLVNLAGGIHALGPGIIIYEIQQSSDITYRLYDWGRMDLNGKPRTLHIEKGVAVSNLESLPPILHTAGNTLPVVDLVQTPFFSTLLHQMTPRNGLRITLDTAGRRFHILTSIGGSVVIRTGDYSVTLGLGQTALIPACVGVYTLEGEARILRSFQP